MPICGLRVVDRVLRLGVRGLRLLPLQGQGVELGLFRRELLAGGVQIVLRIGLGGDGDQHAREGGDGNDDAQGHAGDDLPQVVCLLVRGPCGPADGCSEATSAPENELNFDSGRRGYAAASWKSMRQR